MANNNRDNRGRFAPRQVQADALAQRNAAVAQNLYEAGMASAQRQTFDIAAMVRLSGYSSERQLAEYARAMFRDNECVCNYCEAGRQYNRAVANGHTPAVPPQRTSIQIDAFSDSIPAINEPQITVGYGANLFVNGTITNSLAGTWRVDEATMYRTADEAIAAKRILQERAAAITAPDLGGKPAMSEYDKGVAMLAEYGVNVIPDSECTDMGDYVIWRGWKPEYNTSVGNMSQLRGTWNSLTTEQGWYGESLETLSARAAEDKRYAHPTKPVRIQAWVKHGTRFYQFLIEGGRQKRLTFNSMGECIDSDSYSTCLYAMSGVIMERGPKGVSLAVLRRKYETMWNANKIGRDRYIAALAFVATLAPNREPQRYVKFHGMDLRPAMVKTVRATFKKVGQMVTNHNDTDTQDMIGTLQTMAGSGTTVNAVSRIIAAWNDLDCDELRMGVCGHIHLSEESENTVDGLVCNECFNEDYVYCEDTEQYHPRSDVYEHSDESWYTYSEDGGDSNNIGGRVSSYSANVCRVLSRDSTIVPSQYGDFLMGIELEVAPVDGRRKEPVLHTQALTNGYAIMKEDGSLPNGGFEIVTAPRGLKEHISRFKAWEPHEKLRSWDNNQCGMHVHISSQAFSQITLGKFIEFINRNQNDQMVMAIAGRHPTSNDNARRYCRREDMAPVANPKMALQGKNGDRYRMVNACNLSREEAQRLRLGHMDLNGKNYDTIELRIFRGTLNKNRLLAQIEFAHAAVFFCRVTSMRELGHEHFIKWLRGTAGQYPHLARWFGVRANTQAVEETPKARTAAEV